MTDIENLKELEAKATPGRWQVGFNDGSGLGEHGTGYSIIAPEVAEDEMVVFSGDNDGCLLGIRKKEDAELIAAAKNALPAILASLASKDAEIERLKGWKSRLHAQVDDFAERYAKASQEPKELRGRLTTTLAALGEAREALEPLALIAEHDIGESETDEDIFRPSLRPTVPLLTVGDLRKARATLAKLNALERNKP